MKQDTTYAVVKINENIEITSSFKLSRVKVNITEMKNLFSVSYLYY